MTCSLTTVQGKFIPAMILFALCCMFPLQAQDKESKESGQSEDQIAATIQLLGDEQSKVRNKAYATLERMLENDEKIAGYLQKFNNHQDPEIRLRVKGLLQKQHDKILAEERKKQQHFELKKQNAKLHLELRKQNDQLRVLEKQADGVLRLDPADENKARSLSKTKSLHKIKLSITNQTKHPVKIFTLCAHKHKKEGGGNRKHQAKIEPGKTHNGKETWEKRYYILTDMNDKALGLYLMGKQDARIIFKHVPAGKK